jgi:hypothetical protein
VSKDVVSVTQSCSKCECARLTTWNQSYVVVVIVVPMMMVTTKREEVKAKDACFCPPLKSTGTCYCRARLLLHASRRVCRH